MSVEAEQLELAGEKLRVYDVEQGAWEHESKGYVANATHMLTHLAKDILRKDFTSATDAEMALAPDLVQYALRLMRWTDQSYSQVQPNNEARMVRSSSRHPNFRGMPAHQVAFLSATANLGASLHNEGHESSRADAERRRQQNARDTGRLLVYSATFQAATFDFDLMRAFNSRLAALRDRFNIPDPQHTE